ncbi:MAG TPA: ubiquinone/menaquinone biosynthesis methyltransferase [Acidimicrobiales bacterium]|nr:ubiquinone/menaquinone biosynthesis methyltransferase [Acidimicrobiales bacterium]
MTTLPQGDAKTRQVRSMFDAIAGRYELVNRLMTFGLDARWRRRLVADLRLARGSVVLDVAAGTGDLSRELARQGLRPIATDLSFNMLAHAHDVAHRVQSDALTLPFARASVDGVTCGYALRNFTDLAGTLAEIGRVVRPGGRIAILEVAEPRRGLWRAGFRLWFRRVVPLLGGLLSDRPAYRYLPASTAYLPDAAGIAALLREAGFSAVNHRVILGGLSQQFVATRRA